MKLGTSTNLIYIRPDGTRLALTETLELIKDAGFSVIDFNSYDHTLPGSPLLGDDWEVWIDSVVKKANELGVTFDQCHGYTYNFMDTEMTNKELKQHREIQERVFKCLHKLGAKVCVLHPETDYKRNPEESFRGNLDYFRNILENTKRYGFKIALENMSDMNIRPRRKFSVEPEELIKLIDAIDSSRIGICWDFEHADIMGINQKESILKIGNRLIATHVSDTYSKVDSTRMHVLPLTGTIDWKQAVSGLHEIGYDGVFGLEVHNYMNRFPDSAIKPGLSLAFHIGKYLIELGWK